MLCQAKDLGGIGAFAAGAVYVPLASGGVFNQGPSRPGFNTRYRD